MNRNRRKYFTVALLALVFLGVACAPITITTNAPPAPIAPSALSAVTAPNAAPASNVTTGPNSIPITGAGAMVGEMPLKFFLIHSVFSPDQENANAVTVTRDGEDLTLLSNSSVLTTSGGGSFEYHFNKSRESYLRLPRGTQLTLFGLLGHQIRQAG
jgi:hypothetical protein